MFTKTKPKEIFNPNNNPNTEENGMMYTVHAEVFLHEEEQYFNGGVISESSIEAVDEMMAQEISPELSWHGEGGETTRGLNTTSPVQEEFYDPDIQEQVQAQRLLLPIQKLNGTSPIETELGTCEYQHFGEVHYEPNADGDLVPVSCELEQILGPNSSIGWNKPVEFQWHDMTDSMINIMETKENFDLQLEDLRDLRRDLSIARRAYNGHCMPYVTISQWDPSTGMTTWKKHPIISSLDTYAVPRSGTYLGSLDRILSLKPSLEALFDLKRQAEGQERLLKDFEKATALHRKKEQHLINILDQFLSKAKRESITTKLMHMQNAWDRKVARKDLQRMQVRNEVIDAKNKAKELNPGADIRWNVKTVRGETPLMESIFNHEYYKARGMSAGLYLGTAKVNKDKFCTTKAARPLQEIWTITHEVKIKSGIKEVSTPVSTENIDKIMEAKEDDTPNDHLVQIEQHTYAHRQVMQYLFGGRKSSLGEHPQLPKLKKAINLLEEFEPQTLDAAKNVTSRLMEFKQALQSMEYGQQFTDKVDSLQEEVEHYEMAMSGVLKKSSEFYKHRWPLVPNDLKKRYMGFMGSNSKDINGKGIGEWTCGAEAQLGGFRTSQEVQADSRFDTEMEADESKWQTEDYSVHYMNDLTLSWVQRRFNTMEVYCLKWQEKGKEEGFPSKWVMNPYATWQDLHQDLFGFAYPELYGQRSYGEVNEVEKVVFSDGSVAYNGNDQTHTRFGHRLTGGRMVNFYEHRPLQDHLFKEVWKKLTFQVWGEQFNKNNVVDSTRYNEEFFNI